MLYIVLISAIAGIAGTGAGGFAGAVLSKRGASNLDPRIFMAFAKGVIVGLFVFSILPESLQAQSIPKAIMLIAFGAIVTFFATFLLEKKPKQVNVPDESPKKAISSVLIAAIIVHNFPEGVALGTELSIYPALGLIWAILITLHNVPIGITIGIALANTGYSIVKALVFSALSGVSILAGSIAAVLLGNQIESFAIVLLPLAGGALLSVVLFEVRELFIDRPAKSSYIAALIGLALSAPAFFLI